MSIVKLRKAFRRKMKLGVGKYRVSMSIMDIVFWGIVAIFVVGVYYTFGSPSGGGSGQGEQVERKVTKNVAAVNGHVISRAEFEARYIPQASDIPQAQFLSSDRYVKQSVLEGMMQRLLMLDAAKERGITVSGADVEAKADTMAKEQVDKRFPTRSSLAKYLRKHNQTYDQYLAEVRAELVEDKDLLREAVLFERLEQSVKDAVKISDEDLTGQYTKVKARHILIKPDELKNAEEAAKALDKDKKTEGAEAKKNEAEKDYDALAKKRIENLLKEIKGGKDFAEVAKASSHDFGSAMNGGMLSSTKPPDPGSPDQKPDEYFGRGEMVPEFDEAAFSLKKNEISEPIKTSFGYHIIQVLDRKVEYPKDFKDKKEDYRKQLLEQRKEEAWSKFAKDLRDKAQVNYEDPELAAYAALEKENKTEALERLSEVVSSDPDNVGAKYQLAVLLREAGKKDEATKLYRALVQSERAAGTPQVHMELAELLVEQKLKDEAIEEYKAASEWAQAYDYQSMFIHQQVKAKFEELGKKDLAAQEQVWLDEFTKFQQEQQAEQFGASSMPLTVE